MSDYIIYGIYCACHPEDGIRYVGQTRVGVERRFAEHLKPSGVLPGHALSNWKKKHGLHNIRCEVLEELESIEELNAREVFWIAHYNTFKGKKGLNRTSGGEQEAAKHPESLQKLREANSGETSWSKMTWESVREARKLHGGGETIASLARKYDLSQPAMHRVIRNLSWVDPEYSPGENNPWARPRGSEWYTAKYQDSFFQEIRDDYKSNDLTKLEMAEKWGIATSFMTDILNNKYRPDEKYQPPIKPMPDRVKKTFGRKGVKKPEGFGAKISKANTGSKHPQAKLSEEEAYDILKRYKTGEPTSEIAKQYNTNTDRITRIGRGDRWKHLQDRYFKEFGK